MSTDEDFAALAERLTDPASPAARGSHAASGDAAASRGRTLMLHEFGSEQALDAVLRRAGRVRLGEEPKGASPTVRARIPEADFAAFKQLEVETGKTQSELVRDAVHALLVNHKLVS